MVCEGRPLLRRYGLQVHQYSQCSSVCLYGHNGELLGDNKYNDDIAS